MVARWRAVTVTVTKVGLAGIVLAAYLQALQSALVDLLKGGREKSNPTEARMNVGREAGRRASLIHISDSSAA